MEPNPILKEESKESKSLLGESGRDEGPEERMLETKRSGLLPEL
jgi:hypothetical protein